MKKSDNEKRLKPSIGDAAHTITRAGLSAIPIIGGPATELFNAIIIPPLSKRRDEWIEAIANELKTLEKKVEGLKIENLSKNDTFITTITNASQISIRNHQKEKLEALRNAVLNSALPNPPNEDIQQIFLNIVDSFTPWHLRILNFRNNPNEWILKNRNKLNELYESERRGASHAMILEARFGELKEKEYFYNQIARDLHNRGLINIERFDAKKETIKGLIIHPIVAKLGEQFLNFITSPIVSLNEKNKEKRKIKPE